MVSGGATRQSIVGSAQIIFGYLVERRPDIIAFNSDKRNGLLRCTHNARLCEKPNCLKALKLMSPRSFQIARVETINHRMIHRPHKDVRAAHGRIYFRRVCVE